jgi:hypothetical protein
MFFQCTITAVVQSTASPNYGYGAIFEVSEGNGPVLGMNSGGTNYDAAMSFGSRGTVDGGTPTVGAPTLVTMTYNSASSSATTGTITLQVNGTTVSTGTYSSGLVTSNNDARLYSYDGGGTFGYKGYLATIAIQAAYCASGAQLIAQNRYMGNKYGITVP